MSILVRAWNWAKSPTTMALVAFGSVALAVYQGFFYERRGDLSVSINALSRVFDIHQPVGNLEISYAGENLRSTKKTLWSLSFSVKSTGNAEIKKGDFDDQVPLGLTFQGAQVVETPTAKSNVEYLTHNLKVTAGASSVLLSPVIFEPGDEIQINVLLLGSDAAPPIVRATGKIAGIKSINLVTLDQKSSSKNALEMIAGADALWVHPARFFVYFFGGIFSFLLFVAIPIIAISTPFSKLYDLYQVRGRRKHVAQYSKRYMPGTIQLKLLDLFVERGASVMKSLAEHLIRIKRRLALVEAIGDKVDEEQLSRIVRSVEPLYALADITELKNLGLLVGDGPRIAPIVGLDEANKEVSDLLAIDLPLTLDRRELQMDNWGMFDGVGEPGTEERFSKM